MIEIARIMTQEGIDRLMPEWQALWQRTPAATPFQSPAWLLSWWRCFGSEKPLILAASRGGELIGI
jgi:CelD/BcsL family acetyltransferase involved in cellulose biosynthesis